MKPWMNNSDIKLVEKTILSIGKANLSVLEWGAGGSTKYFSNFMINNNINYDWISIEYNRKWYDSVNSLNIPNVKMVLFDVGNDNLKQRYANMDEYVDYPLTLSRKFDFILVDGRKRRRCLINASKLITKDGVVLLHDAQRAYYHCAFNNFSNHKFLSKTLWVGKNA